MTETVQGTSPPGAPAPGWYADPGGSGGYRWWNGAGWTESVQPPAPAPVATAAPVPVTPVTAEPLAEQSIPPATPAYAYAPSLPVPGAAAGAGHSAFGGPGPQSPCGGPAVPRPAASQHHASPPRMSTAVIAAIGVGLLAVIAGLVFLVSKLMSGSTDAPAADPGAGPRGPAAVVGAKLDARSLANAEETFYTEHQKYLPISATTDVHELGGSVVRLSPTDTATVTLNTAGTAYCIVVTTKSPTSAASSSVVYVSSKGGLLPSSVTRCPAAGAF